MRRAARIDHTQTAIVERLRSCGVAVEVIGKPLDLLVEHGGRTLLIECKSPGGSFTKDQVEFMARWRGEVHVCKTPHEAVRAVLGPDHCDPLIGDIPASKLPF